MSSISTVNLELGTYSIYNKDTHAFENATVTSYLYKVEGLNDANNQPRKLSMAELVMVVCLARAADKEKAVINLMKEMSDTTEILNALTDIETQLLEGKGINSITGKYTYHGITFDYASSFLVALGVIPGGEDMESVIRLCDILDSGTPFFKITGTFTLAGSSYGAYYYLMALMGTSLLSGSHGAYLMKQTYQEMNSLDLMNPNAVLSDSDLQGFSVYYGISAPSGTTAGQMLAMMEEKYDPSLSSMLKNSLKVTPPAVNVSTDQLITDIESKMDSLNSFSQEKMIELQSETNKRDQAYDMITNILKSMNTVEVGIVNNM